MNVLETGLPGVLLIEPRVHADARGAFFELYRADAYAALSAGAFVQDNVSVSRRGVVRGLHFQHPRPQAKLVQTLRGEVFDVAVDVRRGSPTFGRAMWATLSEESRRQVLIPAGFAHGFLVTSDEAVVLYKCTDYYAPDCERSIRWNDPSLAIPWPRVGPLLSPRDERAPLLAELALDLLPRFER